MATTAVPNVSTASGRTARRRDAGTDRARRCSAIRRRCAWSSGTAAALGPTDERRHVAAAITGRLPPAAVEPEPARPGPGLRHGRARRRRRHLRDRRRRCGQRCPRTSGRAHRAGAGGDQGRASARRARPAAAAAAAGGPAARRSPLGAPRRRRDPAPLRRRQRLLPARARAGDDVLVRPLRRRHDRPRRRRRREARPHLPQARARRDVRRAAPRRRVRLGLDGDPRRQRTTT